MVNYAGIKTDSDALKFRDKNQTSWQELDTIIKSLIPSGGIIMWSGAIVDIPSGWYLCNGSNGTPDLRNRFIVGAGDTYAVDATGGEATHALTEAELASHLHTVDPPNTTSGNQSASHNHTINHGHNFKSASGSGTSGWYSTQANKDPTSESGKVVDYAGNSGNQSASHTHDVNIAQFNSGSAGSGTAHENRPPYYALAYIMKA